ncbi:hypothetical protein SESBI_26366 [Sesbania bispinosa]|nr:hypothetical protein SESBI_26366 [Sesbania bispinosa]
MGCWLCRNVAAEATGEVAHCWPEVCWYGYAVGVALSSIEGTTHLSDGEIRIVGRNGTGSEGQSSGRSCLCKSEIDHLTALMRSRTVNAPVREEEKRTEMVPSEPTLPCGQKEYPRTPTLENGIENRLVLTPPVQSSVPIGDVASPAELAKAYMGSRHSKISSSMLGMQNPVLEEDPFLLKNENFPRKSPIMSIMPRATKHAAVHENGFVTPRTHGRSAIYSMARTPYTRIYPTSNLKSGRLAVEGEPSSSSQFALDRDMHSGSKQRALKRSSLALGNDIGSVGPIRRVRHKSNLLYSKGSSLPLSGSSLSVARSGLGIDACQQPSSSMQKRTLVDDVKHNHMKLSGENADDTIPSLRFPPLPSKSSEMASKILQQLDKFVSPKEKSSESRLSIANDNSPMKLSPSMLRGQALRSAEMGDLSKLLENIPGNKSDGTFGNLSASALNQKLTSQRDQVENGPLKLVAPSDELVPVVATADATNPMNQVLSSARSVDSFTMKSVSFAPQKKRAFLMSAHEDSLDLDDDAYSNGAISSFSPVEKETISSTAMAEKISSGTEAIAQENPSTFSVVMPSKSFTTDGEAHVRTAERPRVGEKVDASTTITSSISDPSYKPVTSAVTAATQTGFGSDKPASPNGSIANPPLFNFGSKAVSSTDLTSTGAPSKEINKSGPIFGLEPGADAPLVNFKTNKNVDKVPPPMPFTASTPVGSESTFLKFGACTDSKPESSVSSTTLAGATDSLQKVHESDNGNALNKIDTGSSVRASELGVSSAASTSLLTSPPGIFTFGHSSTQNNGSSPLFSSSFLSPVSNNLTTQNISSSPSLPASCGISATAASTGTSMTTITPAIIASSNNSSSTPVVSTTSTTSFFKFGSSPASPTGLPVSSSGSEPLETKSRQDAGTGNLSSTAFGSSSATIGSTGSGIFGFSSSAMTTLTSQSQCSVIGASSGSVLGAQASPATSGFESSTQTQSVPFGSSASSPLFGLTGNTDFSSGSSLFPSSSSSTNTAFSSGSSLFPSSPTTNIFNSGTTFGLSTSASSSAVNSVSSNSNTSSLFGSSSWQPSKSPFGSTFSSPSSSGFSFGTSSTSSPTTFLSTTSASTPQFSFTSAASTTSTTPQFSFTSVASTASTTPQFSFTSAAATTSTQPAFGSPNPAFTFGSAPVYNNQMSMEDSMAEDTVQSTPPATPIFGQQAAPVQSNFAFGASTPSGTSPFQFGGQQGIASQNPSPFQASGSLEFNAGGSFSLGTGGGDKSGRKILRVKHKQRKK